jgi:hypothetical protein
MGPRRGDNAEIAILELVGGHPKPKVTDTLKRKRARKIMVAEEKAEAQAALVEEAAAAAEAPAEVTEEAVADEEKKED